MTMASDASASMTSLSRDGADGRVDDVDAHLGLVHLVERVLEGLDRALDVGLDDEVEVLELAFADAREQVVEGDVRLLALREGALLERALLGEVARVALVGEDAELVTGGRHGREAQDLDRIGGTGGLDGVALRVDERTDATVGGAGDDGVADAQRAALDEHGGDRTAALVELGLDDDTARAWRRGWP